MGVIHCETSAIFCDMPISLSLVFIIHSAMLSFHCIIGIISSPLATISSTVAAADYHQIRDADWSIQIFS